MAENIKIFSGLVCSIGIVFIFITTVILLSYEINTDIDINTNHYRKIKKIKNIAVGFLGGLLLVLCNFLSICEVIPYYIGIDIFIGVVAYVAGKIISANIALSISLLFSVVFFGLGFTSGIIIFKFASVIIQMLVLNTIKFVKGRITVRRNLSVIFITLTHFLLIYNINKSVRVCVFFSLINLVIGFFIVLVTSKLNGLVKMYNAYRKQALTDGLTGLSNVRAYNRVIKHLAKNKEKCFDIIFIDIDNFKNVNKKFGHCTGDIIIREVGKYIKRLISSDDFCFRVGGDEFLILHNQKDSLCAEKLSNEIKDKISAKEFFSLNNKEIVKITLSIGINKGKLKTSSFCELVQKADMAMYEAKRLGKNKVAVSGQNSIDLAIVSKNIDEK